MTDKVRKIREEIEKGLKGERFLSSDKEYNYLLSFIDSLQEEPVKIKKGCKYRSICNVTNIDTGNISFVAGKIYLAPEDNTLVSEENGWLCDASEDVSNFELVEEPVSEDLKEAANNALEGLLDKYGIVGIGSCLKMFKLGAKWQKQRNNIPQELIDAYWEFQKVGGDSVRVVINAINAIKEKQL